MSKESDFQEILENGISFGRGGGPRSLVLTVVALHGRRPNTVSNGQTDIKSE